MYNHVRPHSDSLHGMSNNAMGNDLVNRDDLPKWDSIYDKKNIGRGFNRSLEFPTRESIDLSFTQYARSFLHSDKTGNFLYSACRQLASSTIYKVNTTTGFVSLISAPFFSGLDNSHMGMVLAPNGFMYVIPFYSPKLVKYNTDTDTGITIHTFPVAGAQGFFSGVCDDFGNIWCPALVGTRFMIINTNDDSVRFLEVGKTNMRPASYSNGFVFSCESGTNVSVVAINVKTWEVFKFGSVTNGHGTVADKYGNVYIIPYSAGNIWKINPHNFSMKVIATTAKGFLGGKMGFNGQIYLNPWDSQVYAKINPENDSYTTFGATPGGLAQYYYSGIDRYGVIWMAPWNPGAGYITRIFTGSPSGDRLSLDYILSNRVNC